MSDDRRFQAHRVEPEALPSKPYALLVGLVIFFLAFAAVVAVLTVVPAPPA